MKTLFIINDPPLRHGARFQRSAPRPCLLKHDAAAEVCVFLMADAVVGARKGQKTPDGYYNVERMLKRVRAGKGRILLCGTCMDARGMIDDDVMDGAKRSTMDELAKVTTAADKVLVF